MHEREFLDMVGKLYNEEVESQVGLVLCGDQPFGKLQVNMDAGSLKFLLDLARMHDVVLDRTQEDPASDS
jgi:hypothetical protein